MIIAIPDPDIKDVHFFEKKNEIAHALLTVRKLSFFLFFDYVLRVGFDSSDERFSSFLNNFRNIYPVRYQNYASSFKNLVELHFLRDPMFSMDPGIDVLSFVANAIEIKKGGVLIVQMEREELPFLWFKKRKALNVLLKSRIRDEKLIAERIIRKLSRPIFRVRIFTDDVNMVKIAYDFSTGQGFSLKGKKIFMDPDEIAYFVHYPLSYNSLRKPW